MKCLVTGGAGFIGSHVAEALVERGDEVVVLDDLSTGFAENVPPAATLISGDISDSDVVSSAVAGVDCVFHQAALASVPRSVKNPLATNQACVTGTLNVLDQARRAGVKRLVYAASSSAYGDQPYSSKRELDLPSPLSPYAVAKLAGEYYCQAYYQTFGFETVCIRYFNVFGPRQDPDSPYSAVIPLFVNAMLQGRQPVVFGDGQQSRDFTFVKNVVHGNLLAAEADQVAGKTINVANGGSTSLLQLIALLNQLLGTQINPEFRDPRPGDVKHSMADITRARHLLGYEPLVSFEDGLAQCIEYYRVASK